MTEGNDSRVSAPRAREITVICPECRRTGSYIPIGRLEELRAIKNGTADCPSCGSSYPVRNGIPILVPAVYINPPNFPDEEDIAHAGFDPIAKMRAGRMIKRFSGSVSLEVGCGKGQYSVYFNGDVVLTDTNFRFVEEAVEHYEGSHEAFGIVSDARLLPFLPDCFSYVLCSRTVEKLSSDDASRAVSSMKEIAAGTLQIDMPNDNSLLALIRRSAVRSGFSQEARYQDPAPEHQTPLTRKDFWRAGFEVHKYAHWFFREWLKLGVLWDVYDALALRFPSIGGTLVAIYSNAGSNPGRPPKPGLWRGDRSMEELWNEVGSSYENRWQSAASRALSAMEMGFVSRFLEEAPGGNVLDLGVGTGRVLDCLLSSDWTDTVRGVDLSEEMATYCRSRIDSTKLKDIAVMDISVGEIPFESTFDFITAVRVLPYCKNWKDVFNRAIKRLTPGGTLVFSMPNRRSINSFTPCPVPVERATRGEIEALALENGVELLAVETFTRLPDVLYDLAKTDASAKVLLAVERGMRKIFGGTLFGRFLFVAVRKPCAASDR